MDVVALLRKYKQPLESFEVDAEIEKSTGGHPEVFTKAVLTFRFKGELDESRVLEAVTLSQTKYCGVSAMLAYSVSRASSLKKIERISRSSVRRVQYIEEL